MSETTTTPNYGLIKPNVNADNDLWGDHLNLDLDTLDSVIHGIDTRAAVTTWNTRAGAVTMNTTDVTTALGYTPYNVTNPAGYQTAAQVAAIVPAGSAASPLMDAVAAPGVATAFSRGDHVHPTDTSRYAVTNPAGYQTAAQVTAALAPYAPLASPALTGNPTAPTPTVGDNDTSIATTAFVTAAVAGLPAYAPLASPVFTGNPTAPTASPGDSDASVATTSFVTAAVRSALNDVGRNLVHNPLFNVAQRGAGPFIAVTSGWTYSLDRWALIMGTAETFNHARQAMTDAYRAQIGDENADGDLVVNFTGGSAAAACCISTQFIEKVNRLSGKTVTVSFYALAAAGSPKLGVSLDQNFGTGGSPSAPVTGAGQSVTISSATWARYSLTFTLGSTAGKTGGTAGNDSTALLFWHSSGSTNATRSGNVGVQTGTHLIWGVQLEVGSVMTPLEKPDPQQDLAKCQRFYQIGTVQIYGNSSIVGAPVSSMLGLPVQMRASPTVTPNWTTQSNITGPAMSVLSFSALLAYGTAPAAGSVTGLASFTASADL